MKADVQFVYRKMRYNLLTINGEHYILDKDNPKWLLFFPFLFWLIPHKAYKITDPTSVNKLIQKESVKTGNVGSFLAIGLSLIIANFLRPLMNYFNVEMPTVLSFIIVIVVFLLIILLRRYISKKNKLQLYHQIGSEHMSETMLFVKLKSIKFILIYIFYYLFVLAFVLGCAFMYIEYGNSIILLIYMMITFLFVMGNLFTVAPGEVKVKFKEHN